MVARRGQGVREAPKRGLKTEAFDAFCELTCCTSFQMAPKGAFEGPQPSPKHPEPQNGINFQPISAFEAATKPYIRFV